MSRNHAVFVVVLVTSLGVTGAQAASEPSLQVAVGTNSTLWLEGDSTLHRFESKATVINLDTDVVLRPDGEPVPAAKLLGGKEGTPSLSKLVLTIPIKDMKSSIAGLGGQMQKALKAKNHPDIVFTMSGYRIARDEAGTNQYDVSVDGTVALAGGSSNITVAMKGSVDGLCLKVKGEKDLLMSSFGVTPPTLFFGTLKTADKVVIKWDMDLTINSTGRSETMKMNRDP